MSTAESQLPHRPLRPHRLAREAARLAGTMAIGQLDRLRDEVLNPEGEVGYDLAFSEDEFGRPRLAGTITGRFLLTCQRCLSEVVWAQPIVVDAVIVDEDEAAARLQSQRDVILAEGGQVSLGRLVEDEILLSLPGYPAHPRGTCSEGFAAGSAARGAEQAPPAGGPGGAS